METGHYFETREKANSYTRRCPDPRGDLFPLGQDPRTWPSCDDAYEFSWQLDPGRYLTELTEVERLKLGRSMGFCPHRRCQLGTVKNANAAGQCPQGLCWTKLEEGAPTFGACCFVGGVFNSGGLLGYYDLLRATPKPMYKRNRVVLGGDPRDERPESFINANEVLPGLIIMQCPVTHHPPSATPTLAATERMLIQEDVGLVLQIDPMVQPSEIPPDNADVEQFHAMMRRAVSKRGCSVWPAERYTPPRHTLEEHDRSTDSAEIAEKTDGREGGGQGRLFDVKFSPRVRLVDMSYELAVHSGAVGGGGRGVGDDDVDASCDATASGRKKTLRHMWYYGWKDFGVPSDGHTDAITAMAEAAVEVLQSGKKVAVTCYAGRGRSGTLAAVVAGLNRSVTTDGELVDLIVTMRESRDGLVETPEQYAFVRRLLGVRRTPRSSHEARHTGRDLMVQGLRMTVRGAVMMIGMGALDASLSDSVMLCTPVALLAGVVLIWLVCRSRRRGMKEE